MKRFEVLQMLASSFPETDLSFSIEQEILPTDLIVLSVDDHITMEHASALKHQMEQIWPDEQLRPRVVVLTSGLTLRVERGVAIFKLEQAV